MGALLLLPMLLLLSCLPRGQWVVVCAEADHRDVYVVYMGNRGDAPVEALFATQKAALSSVFDSELDASSSVLHHYKHAFSGFAAHLTAEQAKSLAGAHGVVSVFKSKRLKLHTTQSWQFLGVTSADFRASWTNAKADVIVGILDTGIWPEAKSFRDHAMGPVPSHWKGVCESNGITNASIRVECNRKLIGARSYFDAASFSGLLNHTELEFTNARDSNGHGTHTASTVAGRVVDGASLYGLCKGDARGGSPRSRIAVYKVCFYTDCLDHAVLAAFDDAVHDGVDILSVSLGGPAGSFDEDSIAIGSFHAIKHGVLVSSSAGNSGPFHLSVTNVAPWVMTVGSSSTNRNVISSLKLGNGRVFEGAGLNIDHMKRSSYGLVFGGDAAIRKSKQEQASFCLKDSLNASKVRDQIVLCHWGSRAGSRVGNASGVLKSMGAAGVIQVNELAVGVAFSFSLPFTIVDNATGKHILSYVRTTKNASAVILPTQVTVSNMTSASVSVFSSRGPSRLGLEVLKPDLLAPGANILAAWTPVKSPLKSTMTPTRDPPVFNIMSGTSMSCPHAAGAAAYVKSFHPDWSPSMIKSALMTTAGRAALKDFNGDEVEAFDTGAGEMSPVRATDPGLVYDVSTHDYVLYLCATGYSKQAVQGITGLSNITCRRDFRPENLNYPTISIAEFDGTNRTVMRTVTNVGPPSCVYRVSVAAPKGIKVTVVPSVLRFAAGCSTAKYYVKVSGEPPRKGYASGSLTWSDGVRSATSVLIVYAAA